jgi:hypothetical protein
MCGRREEEKTSSAATMMEEMRQRKEGEEDGKSNVSVPSDGGVATTSGSLVDDGAR